MNIHNDVTLPSPLSMPSQLITALTIPSVQGQLFTVPEKLHAFTKYLQECILRLYLSNINLHDDDDDDVTTTTIIISNYM